MPFAQFLISASDNTCVARFSFADFAVKCLSTDSEEEPASFSQPMKLSFGANHGSNVVCYLNSLYSSSSDDAAEQRTSASLQAQVVKKSACCCPKGARAAHSKLRLVFLLKYCNVVYNVVDQTNPVSPVYMASTSQTASRHYQAVTPQLKLQKALRNTKPIRGL